jgi:hypothetical protein
MGGRAVEGTGLENRQTFTRLEGSNPSPSAIIAVNWLFLLDFLRLVTLHPPTLPTILIDRLRTAGAGCAAEARKAGYENWSDIEAACKRRWGPRHDHTGQQCEAMV